MANDLPQTGDLVFVPREGPIYFGIVEAMLSTGQLLVRPMTGGELRKIDASSVDAWHRADWRRETNVAEQFAALPNPNQAQEGPRKR